MRITKKQKDELNEFAAIAESMTGIPNFLVYEKDAFVKIKNGWNINRETAERLYEFLKLKLKK